MATTTAKICGLCGADCSDRPRIKDKNGKYFCKTCHDEARARSRRTNESRAEAPTNDFAMLNVLADSIETSRASAREQLTTLPARASIERARKRGAAGSKALGEWRGPIIFGSIVSLLFIPLGILAWVSANMFGVFALAATLWFLAYLYWLVRVAGKESTLIALLCLLVPLYFLYFVYGRSTNRYLKIGTIVYGIVVALLVLRSLGAEPAFKRNDLREYDERQSPLEHEGLRP
ncbi:MAG: hypothetical protein L0219_13560 [Phycisphaerales bacterium]|nr:hypothetical protein [Phycisphaerales bacterium]